MESLNEAIFEVEIRDKIPIYLTYRPNKDVDPERIGLIAPLENPGDVVPVYSSYGKVVFDIAVVPVYSPAGRIVFDVESAERRSKRCWLVPKNALIMKHSGVRAYQTEIDNLVVVDLNEAHLSHVAFFHDESYYVSLDGERLRFTPEGYDISLISTLARQGLPELHWDKQTGYTRNEADWIPVADLI